MNVEKTKPTNAERFHVVSVRINDAEYQRIVNLALENDLTLSQVVRRAVRNLQGVGGSGSGSNQEAGQSTPI